MKLSNVSLLLVANLACLTVGCSPPAEYTFNEAYARKQASESGEEYREIFNAQRVREVGTVMTALFGTPDSPQLPQLPDVDLGEVVDINKLKFAAGPVGSDESGRAHGLYREHCAHCHGVTGDGAGPTAFFLNPYPRDYRMGVYKFKSTPKGFKPTHADLTRVLMEGINGTAMPSFKVLPENEVEALVHYVKYLSIRGETERFLLNYIATELDADVPLLDLQGTSKQEEIDVLRSLVAEVVQRWVDSESEATEVPAPDANRDLLASARHGRELFYGQVANCIKCHGDSALGDGQVTDYDDWTKELNPQNEEEFAVYLDAGALPARNIRPRNLRLNVFRGGRRPIDIYWRIKNGIDGTPMPAVPYKAEGADPSTAGLTDEEIWNLIDYVRSLPYEHVSRPTMPDDTHNQRERL